MNTSTLERRVVMLGEYFSIGKKDRDEALALAERVAKMPQPEGTVDVVVEVRRHIFPLRERYGLAVEAFRDLVKAHQRVDDLLDIDARRICNMLGADRSEKKLEWSGLPQTNLFRFFPTGPLTRLVHSPKRVSRHLRPARFTLTYWHNLCLYVTDPDDFLGKAVVAVSDRVENGTRHMYNHAPALRGNRTKLVMYPVDIDRLQAYPLFHREGQCFESSL